MPDNDNKQGAIHHSKATNRLRRLQFNERVELTQMLAQRSIKNFSLQRDAPVDETARTVEVIVYPQDPFVGEPEIRTIPASDIRPGLVNSRIEIADESPAQPDENGNYLYMPGQPEFNQVNAFYYATITLRMLERYAQRTIPWAFPHPRLLVDANHGDEANAFYHEQERMLGFHTFERDGVTVSTAQSADIVSHEAAHAVLDGLRDLYNESFGMVPNAFHESFGDIVAILVALHDESLMRRLLEWTEGDMRMSSFVTAIAEELIDVLKNQSVSALHKQTIYLRNALNSFKAVPFDDLRFQPPNPEVELGRQEHNYSRVFTGAFYNILAGIYETLREKDKLPSNIALHRARDIGGTLLITAIELGPVGEFNLCDMALAFVSADLLRYKGRYRDLLRYVFVEERWICTPEKFDAHIHALENLPDLRLPETINSALNAMIYLDEVLIPTLDLPRDVEFFPMATYRNNSGDAFMTFFCTRNIILEGEQFAQHNGAEVELFGGLSLAFDKENRLKSAYYRPATDEDERQNKIMIAHLIGEGNIADGSDDNLGTLLVKNVSNAIRIDGIALRGKLIRVPISIDRMPFPSDLVGYLQRIKHTIVSEK